MLRNNKKQIVAAILALLYSENKLTFAETPLDNVGVNCVENVNKVLEKIQNCQSKNSFNVKDVIIEKMKANIAISLDKLTGEQLSLLITSFDNETRIKIYKKLSPDAAKKLKADVDSLLILKKKSPDEFNKKLPIKLTVIDNGEIEYGSEEFTKGIATDGTPGYKGNA